MFAYLPVSKQSQVKHNHRPTQKQLGDISNKVREEVRKRSGGVCELCKSSEALQMAHLIGRKQLTELTTAKILLHVCVPCHKYLDEDPKGIKLKRRLVEC